LIDKLPQPSQTTLKADGSVVGSCAIFILLPG